MTMSHDYYCSPEFWGSGEGIPQTGDCTIEKAVVLKGQNGVALVCVIERITLAQMLEQSGVDASKLTAAELFKIIESLVT